MTGTCRGCRIPGCLLDVNGICHDCAYELAADPDLTTYELAWIMPGPEAT